MYNRDILISSVAAALAGIITMLAQLAWFIPIGRSDDDDGPGILGVLMLLILGPLAAAIIQMAISRSREYQADASGATLTNDPLALADALRKIHTGTQAMPLPADGQLATHRPPDDRQPVPGRRSAQACSPPTRRWRSGSPASRRWPATPARSSTAADPFRTRPPRSRPPRLEPGRPRLPPVR